MNSLGIAIFFILIYLRSAYSFVDLSYFKTFVASLVDDKGGGGGGGGGCPGSKAPKEACDENQVMLHLAKMYIISPERILLLITSDSLLDSCKEVQDTINKVNKTLTGCIPLSSDNLYIKLLNTVKFYHSSVCQGDSRLKKKLTKIGDCLPELREEFLDCEGAPDWYENMNQTVRCHVFNDILNCNYVKTAMLCGLEPASTIRSFTTELFQQALPSKTKCKISRSLPNVQDPMPALSNQKCAYSVWHLTSFIVLIKTIL